MIYITRDFVTAERAGREGYFQISAVMNDGEDITEPDTVGQFFSSGEAVLKEYGFNPESTDWDFDE